MKQFYKTWFWILVWSVAVLWGPCRAVILLYYNPFVILFTFPQFHFLHMLLLLLLSLLLLLFFLFLLLFIFLPLWLFHVLLGFLLLFLVVLASLVCNCSQLCFISNLPELCRYSVRCLIAFWPFIPNLLCLIILFSVHFFCVNKDDILFEFFFTCLLVPQDLCPHNLWKSV